MPDYSTITDVDIKILGCYFWCSKEQQFISEEFVHPALYCIGYIDGHGNTAVATNKQLCPSCGHPLNLGTKTTPILTKIPVL